MVDFAIANRWMTSNYGALLTAYALQRLLSDLGHTSVLISGFFDGEQSRYRGSLSERFASRHLQITAPCSSEADFKALNGLARGFITGSDQVWRGAFARPYLFLDFAGFNRRKIAVAASFGLDRYEPVHYSEYRVRKWLQRFSAVSVRERSGVGICLNSFGVRAVQLMDPVFLLDPRRFRELSDSSEANLRGDGVYYVLDKSDETQKAVHEAERLTGTTAVDAAGPEVEDWLASISRAKYVVTDSFHGVCFAILNHRPFACLGNSRRGSERFAALYGELGIPAEDVTSSRGLDGLTTRDWELFYREIDARIDRLRAVGIFWMRDALSGGSDGFLRGSLRRLAYEIRLWRDCTGERMRRIRYWILSHIMLGRHRKRYRKKLEW